MLVPSRRVTGFSKVRALAGALLAFVFSFAKALALTEGLPEVRILALELALAFAPLAFSRDKCRRAARLSLLNAITEASILSGLGHRFSGLLQRDLRLVVQVCCLLFCRS